ncbi:undecaprenyldiphospho-muramoylpentapeptide beta-N-acetylglucosaminyltransferase [Nitrosomonas communis]|uniref:UDP-N-acetylglucosamine--N-acetylmuramyl-(pentapeptide) pyrophosphoryl-undecaprenol N-acetylglucosamine transferase n=1 Tax=Nitrosomonas communis TaxID=44574 RepID=A0A1H2TJK3_9PROT|nr:undecaprenyldiphospho-muramoylpentapeptide beta-N-acetylglucosaminyltransferase [Nitrosomonas communis]SDW44176.1 UDP-N-acetylglucosamine--N-acetylmuramyl-(pentapeptide) pyrophosphoryl-undecaprenol N-acetylglucosamine transferase [Nitrosomonas communis]
MIMAGGTGGHVFPGLAVADHMKTLDWNIVWLGTYNGMEAVLVPKHGYHAELIEFSGLRGKKALDWLWLPWRLLLAFWQSARIIIRTQPDVVLGMGGYPAFPGGIMASLLNKPLLIHEQNAIPGLTNRVLAKIADKILLGFPAAIEGTTNKVQVTGNPVRYDILRLPVPEQRFAKRSGRLKVLVIGGSLGARILNTTIPQALKLIPANERPWITHQAGKNNLNELQKNYSECGVEGDLVSFIEDIAASYAECDLVICRAGALTISELAVVGVASILVPYPFAVDDHQTANAQFLSQHNAALLLPQDQLTPEVLADLIQGLTRERLLEMATLARSLAKPDATRIVAEVCLEIGARAR